MRKNIIVPGKISERDGHAFDIKLDAGEMSKITKDLDLLGLKKARINGEFFAIGKKDWRLAAKIGATVTQTCVVTLEPVNTRIEDNVVRTYLAQFDEPEEPEVEMGEDETIEPLPIELDLIEVFSEALSLALPVYPKKENAALSETNIAEPGVAPLTDDDVKPFAGLKDLRDKMAKK